MKVDVNIQVRMGISYNKGISCIGYLPKETAYEDIVGVFGGPTYGANADGKIKVEWRGTINKLIFSIYDYKSPLEPLDNTDWHIGGDNKMAADLVLAYFNSKK